MTEVTERGEVSIELEPGVEYVMRPSFEAITAVERASGKSMTELADAASRCALPLATLATIVLEFVKAWGKGAVAGDPPHRAAICGANQEKVAKLIYGHLGAMKAQVLVGLVLLGAVNGSYTPEGTLKPGEAGAGAA